MPVWLRGGIVSVHICVFKCSVVQGCNKNSAAAARPGGGLGRARPAYGWRGVQGKWRGAAMGTRALPP